jgi:type I restriction enzyme S subunit
MGKMTSGLKPYPAYKDSGVPWLGEVPEHWVVKRNKLFMREVNDRSEDGSEELLTVSQYTGVTRRRERLSDESDLLTNAASLVGYKRVMPGDLVMNIMLAWNGSLGVSAVNGIASPAYCVFRAKDGVDPRFLHYLLRTPLFTGAFKTVSTGVVDSRLRLYPDVFFRLSSQHPPFPEQAAIVRFLDYADRRIRRFVRAKKKLVALLNEQRQAIIQRAVTRGLDPNVSLKQISLESIEQIPDHWQITKLSRLTTSIGDGLHGSPEYVEESPYHFINGNNLSNGAIRITSTTQYVSASEFERYKIALDESTLLMSINGTIGSLAYYQGESIILGKSAAYINCDKALSRSYLFFLLQSAAIGNFFQREVTGTTIFNLSLESVRNIPVALPPPAEQLEISSFLALRTAEFNELIDKVKREIDLLREFRTCLIADVVTGKLNVREAAARLRDDRDEVKPLDDADALTEDEKEAEGADLEAAAEEAEA